MVRPYSVDLRKRVLEYIEETKDKTKASQLFKVRIATIYRWIARKTQTGNLEPSPSKAYKKKIDDQKLITYLEEHPDHFLSEIAAHFRTTLQAIFMLCNDSKSHEKKDYALQGKKRKNQIGIYRKNRIYSSRQKSVLG
jgi:hypothetical protein